MDTNLTIFSSIDRLHGSLNVVPYNVCIDLPPQITSDGLWAIDPNDVSTLQHTFTILELQIITIFIVTQCFHFFLKRLGIPYFYSSVMAGFVLGPTTKIYAFEKHKKMLFPFGSEDIISVISSFGFTFYIFISFVQMDFSMIARTGRKAWTIAISTVIIPIFLGFLSTKLFSSFWETTIGNSEASGLPIVFISHSGVHFPVIAALLNDLKILNSELGHLALASALVSDITTDIVNGIGTAIVSSMEKGMTKSYINLAMFISLYIMVPMTMRPVMRWMVRHTPEGRHVKKIYIYLIICMVLLLGLLMGIFNQPIFAGALVLGLSVPEGPPLGSEMVNHLELFSTWFLFPIFITTCIMKVDLTMCHTPYIIFVLASFIIVVHLIRLLVSVGICRLCNMPTSDGICIGLILGCKGAVDICSYTLIYDAEKYSDETIGVMIISVLVVGGISKFGVKSLYDPSRKYAGYQKRNIMNIKKLNSELHVVACIHKPSHITTIKNFLELCSPTSNNPLVVDVIHLMELIGRSSPIFISHRHQQMTSSSLNNFSGELIVTFNLFEHDYAGVATVNTYTAISPINLMHEDVCYVAMDKIASIIILPFHIKYSDDGLFESEDKNIRSLNTKVMEKAPCSIGILVNRGSYYGYKDSSNKEIALIFLGGADDREALCFAKRSVKESDNRLCVFRLVAKDINDTNSWDYILDNEMLKELQTTYHRGDVIVDNVIYEEVIIEDASKTASFVNEMAHKFDFIIVGRRNGVKSPQTDALVNWTEYSELGVVGDLLASPDLETRASILVVQQQQLQT